MKEIKIDVSSAGAGMHEALELTEKLGEVCRLGKKQALHLRLLAEELLGLLRSIAGDAESVYSVKQDGGAYEIGLQANLTLTREMREQLIALSSSGENAAAKGFMGKLRDMIAEALTPEDVGVSVLSGFSLGMMSGATSSPSAMKASTDALRWSLNKYRLVVVGTENGQEAKDELERSIVASIADEVGVSVVGSRVEITIYKTFEN